MSVELRKAGPDDREAVVRLLQKRMNPGFGPERWGRLFDQPWRPEGADLGLVVEDAARRRRRIVGYHGHIHADRPAPGGAGTIRSTNFTSWYLDKDYRGRGLGGAMVRAALADADATCTVFSLSKKRIAMFRGLGLTELEGRRALFRRPVSGAVSGVEVLAGAAQLQGRLTPAEQRLVADHAGMNAYPAVAEGPAGRCFVMLTRAVKDHGELFVDVLHRSDAEAFTAYATSLAEALLDPAMLPPG